MTLLFRAARFRTGPRPSLARRRAALPLIALLSGLVGCAATPVDSSPPAAPTSGPDLADVAAVANANVANANVANANVADTNVANAAAAQGDPRIDLAAPLGADDLARIAVLTNPELQAMRAREQVASAQVFAAGLLPDPGFSLSADLPRGGANLVTALTASLGMDLAAVLARPRLVAARRADRDAVRMDIAWAEWLTAEQARLLATRVTHLRAIRTLTRRYRTLADADLARAEAAAARGDLDGTALGARRLTAAGAADRDRSAEQQLQTAAGDLDKVLGVDPSTRIELAPAAAPVQRLPDAGALFQQAVAARADLAGLRAGLLAADADLRAADLQRYPLPTLLLTAARDTSDVHTLGPGISLNLPLWNRGRGQRAIATATLAQRRADYQARLAAVRAEIASARSALELARRQQADVQSALQDLPAHVDALERAVARGDLSASAVAGERMAVLDKRIVAADLARTEAELAIALEIATGHRLEPAR